MKEKHKWNLADTVTSLRIVACLILIFIPLETVWFLVIYTVAGISDVVDGTIARKFGKSSDFGATLDSISDLVFYGVMIVKMLPTLIKTLPGIIWYGVAAILVIRIAAYVAAAIKYKRFAAIHTWLNKLTGAGVFGLPYAFAFSFGTPYSFAVCIIAFVASTEEFIIHIFTKEYNRRVKSVFDIKKTS